MPVTLPACSRGHWILRQEILRICGDTLLKKIMAKGNGIALETVKTLVTIDILIKILEFKNKTGSGMSSYRERNIKGSSKKKSVRKVV